MAEPYGRITKDAFKALISVFFALAILAVIARIAVGKFLHRQLRVDDYFLFASCVFLIAATGLLYHGLSSVFLGAKLTFDPSAILAFSDNEAEILHEAKFLTNFDWAYLSVSWTAIFLVKFGFLAFFRAMVDRVPPIYRLWKVTTGFTFAVFLFAICDGIIACPKLGLASQSCSATSAAVKKALAIGTLAIVLDMVTDFLILAIPICIIWQVRVRPRQKLGLALFLCLSCCMVLIAITRISGLHYRGKFDNTWIFLWQQMEACIAVTMLSLTAFRSVFVASTSGYDRNNNKNQKASPWVPSVSRVLRLKKSSKSRGNGGELEDVTIPSATLTGISRFFLFGRSQTLRTMAEGEENEQDQALDDLWVTPKRNKQDGSSAA